MRAKAHFAYFNPSIPIILSIVFFILLFNVYFLPIPIADNIFYGNIPCIMLPFVYTYGICFLNKSFVYQVKIELYFSKILTRKLVRFIQKKKKLIGIYL